MYEENHHVEKEILNHQIRFYFYGNGFSFSYSVLLEDWNQMFVYKSRNEGFMASKMYFSILQISNFIFVIEFHNRYKVS